MIYVVRFVQMKLQALETLTSAEIEAKSRGILHENITINYQGFDDKCSQEFATAQVIAANADFCAHVIFGPACDYCSGIGINKSIFNVFNQILF